MPDPAQFIFDPESNAKDQKEVQKVERQTVRDIPLEERERRAAAARSATDPEQNADRRIAAHKHGVQVAEDAVLPIDIDLDIDEPEDVSGDEEDEDHSGVPDDFGDESDGEDDEDDGRFDIDPHIYEQPVVVVNEPAGTSDVDPTAAASGRSTEKEMRVDYIAVWGPGTATSFLIGDNIQFKNPLTDELIKMACTGVDYDLETGELNVTFNPVEE